MSSQYVPMAMKQQVFERARGLCEYCRSPAKFAIDPLVMDHVEPVSLRGRTVLENLALACQTCNNYKRDKVQAIDPATGQMVILFDPRQMNWSDHFVWDENGTQMLGLTSIGRATVTLLRSNRDGVMNVRRVLITMGEHPPAD